MSAVGLTQRHKCRGLWRQWCLLPRSSQDSSRSPDWCSGTKRRFPAAQWMLLLGICGSASETPFAVTAPPFTSEKEKRGEKLAGFWWPFLRAGQPQVGWPTVLVARDFPGFCAESPTSQETTQSRANRGSCHSPSWWWWPICAQGETQPPG